MSKKPQKNQPQKKETQIVEQQKDPMLRALQKKVRNINKKLNQIIELSSRKDLKPEQEQKISKKNQVIQQREKYQQMIEIYKEIAGESEKIIRKTQLTQLEDLAGIIATREFGADLGATFNQNVDNLVKILTTPASTDLSIKQRVDEITAALTNTANNTKLKKSVKDYILANPTKKANIESSVSNQPQPISPQSEQQRENQIKQLQQEEKLQFKDKMAEPSTPQVPSLQSESRKAQLAHHQSSQDKKVIQQVKQAKAQEQKKHEASTSIPTHVSAPVPVPVPVPAPTVSDSVPVPVPSSGQQKKIEEGVETKKETTQNKNPDTIEKRGSRGPRRGGRGEGRGQGERGEGGRYYDDRKNYKKPSFKPKYEESKPRENRQNVVANDQDSSSDSQPKAREFKREEVRQLIEDGFIVVGKPKVKARDQKQFYDRQHGKKHHHHNSKRNF